MVYNFVIEGIIDIDMNLLVIFMDVGLLYEELGELDDG